MAMYVLSIGAPHQLATKLTFFQGTLGWVGAAATLGLAYEASADKFFERQN